MGLLPLPKDCRIVTLFRCAHLLQLFITSKEKYITIATPAIDFGIKGTMSH